MAPREHLDIRQELAEIREAQVAQRVEIKWTKWLAAGALGASTMGQLTSFKPPTAVIDLIVRFLW